MNTLHYSYYKNSQIFWDDLNTIITSIHENDGVYRQEYMSSLFEHFRIHVQYHEDIPEIIKSQIKNEEEC